jgi:DNA end-binding protein Ku
MARSIWSGFLSFGLVNVPVGLYPATADQTIHFNQLHKGTSHRIRYKKVDEVTGDEVKTEEIVSGFPLGGGEYVVVTRDELKEAAPGKSETIEISDFVDLGEIDPVHFRQTYYLAPRGKGADRAYALLRQAMDETGKIGIATMVLRDKEHLVAVRPGDDVLILETMYFADEIRSPSEELETLPQDTSFQGRELDVAKRLVESLTVPWAPEDYRNTYRARVEELIEHKREGQAVVFEAERPKSNVIDLMAALEASVAKMGPAASGGTTGTGAGERGTGGTGAGGTGAGTGARGRATPARGTGGGQEGGGGGRAAGGGEGRGGGGPAAGRGRAPEAETGPAGLNELSKADLLARAAELDIPGRSKMSKPELIKAIQAAARPKRGTRKIS